jgi:hypothetical protein
MALILNARMLLREPRRCVDKELVSFCKIQEDARAFNAIQPTRSCSLSERTLWGRNCSSLVSGSDVIKVSGFVHLSF